MRRASLSHSGGGLGEDGKEMNGTMIKMKAKDDRENINECDES